MSIYDNNSEELKRECCDEATAKDDLIDSLNYFDSGGSTWDYDFRGGKMASFDKEGTLEAEYSPKEAALILLKEISEATLTKKPLVDARSHEHRIRIALMVIHHIFSKT